MSRFSHHDRFSDTMGIVLREIVDRFGPQEAITAKILDIPAGAGRLTDKLREKGFIVVPADINGERDDYIFANMNKKLPFPDEEFDAAISMEGIEHIINYSGFIRELSRITKRGGTIILTTPNVSCFYSRLMFMCTGNFFQFWPAQGFVNIKGEEEFDFGHITPLTWQHICFHFQHYGVTLRRLLGNKIKRKVLFPVYIPFMIIGFPWIKYRWRRTRKAIKSLLMQTDFYQKMEEFSYSLPAMFARNIIIILEKRE